MVLSDSYFIHIQNWSPTPRQFIPSFHVPVIVTNIYNLLFIIFCKTYADFQHVLAGCRR